MATRKVRHSKKQQKKAIRKTSKRSTKQNNKMRKHKSQKKQVKRVYHKMKGGNTVISNANPVNSVVPFLPPNSSYYYPLTADLHAPNDAIVNTSTIPVSQNGGRKRNAKRGGGIIPVDILNLGRNAMAGVQSVYNGVVGDNMVPSSYPNITYQPALENPSDLNIDVPDVQTYYTNADSNAAEITASQ